MPNDRESRRIAQEQVVTALARHTSYLHRASTAQVNAITKAIESLSTDMTREVADRLDNLTPAELSAFSRGRYTTDRLRGLRNVIDGWAVKMGSTLNEMALGGFKDLAGHEAEFARTLLSESIEGTLPAAPTAAAAYASAVAKPLLGEMVEDMLADIPERAKRQVYSRIRQGISQGETNYQIIRALRGTKALNYKDGVLQTSRNDVERVVRTSRSHISNESYEETYRALGVEELVWVSSLDGRTSKICASRDGARFKVGSNHPSPPAHPNCLPGDSLVLSRTGVTGGSKRWFDGEVVVIKTASGRELTSTPNHPILTPSGWVGAGLLNVGGDVISDSGSEWEALLSGDHQHMISSIEDKFSSLLRSGEVLAAPVPVSPEHFHGDGAGSKVAVVLSECLLRSGTDSSLKEHLSKSGFKDRVMSASGGNGSGGFYPFGFVSLPASGCFMSFACKLKALFRASPLHSSKLLCRSVSSRDASRLKYGFRGSNDESMVFKDTANTDPALKQANNVIFREAGSDTVFVNRLLCAAAKMNTVVPEDARNHLVSYAKRCGNLALGFPRGIARNYRFIIERCSRPVVRNAAPVNDLPESMLADIELSEDILNGRFGDVFPDKIVSIERRNFAGHVFNLETEKGFYTANGIVTHNCRSVLAPSFDGEVMGQRPYVRSLKVKGNDDNAKFRPIGKMTQKQREDAELEVGQVAASTNYSKWFGNQPASFQREWLGDSRYRLYRDGGYSIDRFVDPIKGELTLDQLRQRDAATFAELFG